MTDPEGPESVEFSERDIAILSLLADDRQPADIAEVLDLPLETVDAEIMSLLTALSASSTRQAVAKAIGRNLIGPGARRFRDEGH
jgi:DNA-binding NarL/FixJ family response regulator